MKIKGCELLYLNIEFGVEDVIVVHKDSFEKYKFDDVLPYNNKIKFED